MLPPIRHQVTVAADPERAFQAFTDDISGWWPLAQMNVLGAGSLVGFADGILAEATVDGSEAVWGEVQAWEPGRRLRFTWHPGAEPSPHTEVTVTFDPTDTGTLVGLEHAGWEALADPAATHAEYDAAWPAVLALYSAHTATGEPPDALTGREGEPGATVGEPGATVGDPTDTWVALMHTPGPSAPTDGSLFADPRFGEHVAFLQRMTERGYLVAAGPLAAADGSGMTILRLPGADRVAEATELATVDDLSVADGLLSVSIQPWNVLFHTLD